MFWRISYTLGMNIIGILLLGALTLLAISLQRTYGSVPVKELKRRARQGDKAAATLHRVAAYGASLRALLWLVIVGLAAWFFLVVASSTATWFAFVLSAMLLWFGFIWLPAQDATQAGMWLAGAVAPALEKVLQYIHPVIDRLQRFIQAHRPINVHTGLYDTSDLLDLFDRQRVQSDNRISQQTLQIVEHALQFDGKRVADILTPRRVVKAVSMDETIGPVLMTDLHKSGFSRFPVYEGKQDNIVGVLYLRDLVHAKSGGTVQKIMSKRVCYVHEDEPLTDTLQAILHTHQQLYVVVNSFEEYVGIVSIEDILEEIIGKQIVDEFDQYEDMRAVAGKLAVKDHQQHIANETTQEEPAAESSE